jgi:DNA-binding LacI/PurR family transcriptional regulator
MNKPSIVQLAQKIGVSPTTISRAISGRRRIGKNTRQMVLRQMKEFGYVPNPHAQQLVTGRGKMILLHAADGEVDFMVQMARGIQNTLWGHGYGLVLDTTSSLDQEGSLLREWIVSGAVDGAIVITGAPNLGDRVARLVNPRTPVVTVGYPSVEPATRMGSVIWNLKTGADEVADMLAASGHKRIGFIDIGRADPVVEAFRNRLAVHGVSLEPDWTWKKAPKP